MDSESVGMALVAAALAFLLFCVVVGTRRWKEIKASNERGYRLAEEAVSDRKKILAVLEEIHANLKNRKI
jgi:hypothetical protein